MKDLISIIVPIYKVAPYLDRCVRSLIQQTYENIEIILVDDGSPDECPQLCDEWQEKDDRIKVLHKENGGLSSARNSGIAIAKGEYIAFVDGDDYVACDMCEKLYEAIQRDQSDMCICNFCMVDDEGNVLETEDNQSPIRNDVYSKEEVLRIICAGTKMANEWRFVPAWNKLYRKEIFASCLFEEGRLHEDEFAIHHFVHACDKISTISDELYYYVQRANSIMSSQFSIRRFDVALALKDRYLFVKEIDKELGVAALLQLYVYLLFNLDKYDVKGNRKIIEPVVYFVIKEQIKNRNRSALKLMWIYFKKLI